MVNWYDFRVVLRKGNCKSSEAHNRRHLTFLACFKLRAHVDLNGHTYRGHRQLTISNVPWLYFEGHSSLHFASC